MKFRGVIFDLDGVLCFTDDYHYQAWKSLADDLNIYFDREINNRLRGVSRMASLDIVLEKSNKKYSDEEKVGLATKKNDIYVKLLDNITENDCSNEVRNTLLELKRRGIKIAIGSSSKNTPKILNRLGIYSYFDAISDGNNITHSKPNPEVFLKAAQFINENPQDCLIVEVKTYSKVNYDDANKFSKVITDFISLNYNIKKSRIYVAYFDTLTWSFEGENF